MCQRVECRLVAELSVRLGACAVAPGSWVRTDQLAVLRDMALGRLLSQQGRSHVLRLVHWVLIVLGSSSFFLCLLLPVELPVEQ